MNSCDIASLPSDTTERLLKAIPFYKSVRQHSEVQYQALLRYSKITQHGPGGQILIRGERNDWSYFLVKGQLVVSLADQYGQPVYVNEITPGEVFGDLAALLKTPRTADVIVDKSCREAVVFGTDFSIFGQLSDFSIMTMATKLIYYRHKTQSLRWKLEIYRSKHSDHVLANEHRKVRVYTGDKGGLEELHALYEQSVKFARLIVKWNQAFGGFPIAEDNKQNPYVTI